MENELVGESHRSSFAHSLAVGPKYMARTFPSVIQFELKFRQWAKEFTRHPRKL